MNLLSPFQAASLQPATLQASTLVVTGEGQVETAPDAATLTLGVTVRNQQAAPAFQQAANTLNQIVRALVAAGVPQQQIQTSQVSLNPVFENGRQVGFDATATVRVTLRDLTSVGVIIDRGVAAGANNIVGISFELLDPTAAQAAALNRAVQDAQRQAAVLARSLGVALGPLNRAEAEPTAGPIAPLGARVAAAEAIAVQPGTLTVTRRVRVEFLASR